MGKDNKPTEVNNNDKKILLTEFTELWSHYRHLESNRATYIGFFFTVIIASIGYYLKISIEFYSSAKSVNSELFIFGSIIFGWILLILNLYIYSCIKKIGYVLYPYEKAIENLRHLVYSNKSDIDSSINIRKINSSISNTLSIQQLSNLLLLVIAIILYIIIMSSTIFSFCNSYINCWQFIILSILLIILNIGIIFIWNKSSKFIQIQNSHDPIY